jgi:hypothetical protein
MRKLVNAGDLTAQGDRDSWCTPAWLTALLSEVDLDPCGNPRSTVRAVRSYQLERGEDGLALPWVGSCFVNPPYGNPLPWAERAAAHDGPIGVLVNLDASTRWWRTLTAELDTALLFTRRIQFTPPPGVRPSTNNKPQALVMNAGYLALCSDALLAFGARWHLRSRPAPVVALHARQAPPVEGAA